MQILKIKHAVLLLTLFAFTLYSCGDDSSDDAPPMPGTAELLMTGSWKLVGYTIDPGLDTDGDGDLETDLFLNFPDCRKDDTYTFINHYVVELNNGPTKCEADDPQVWNWYYDLSADEKRMMYDGNEYSIAEINTTTFRLQRFEYRESTGLTHVRELVYNH